MTIETGTIAMPNKRKRLLQLENYQVFRGGQPVTARLNWEIYAGEFWVLIGKTGSGKTSLAQSLAGLFYYHGQRTKSDGLTVSFIEQQHHFKNRSNTSDFYYQQRFQSQDAEDAASLREMLRGYDEKEWLPLIEKMHLSSSIDKPMIQLSNGENKRFQLVLGLLTKPELLILDNPFTGLDIDGRKLLHHVLDELHTQGIAIVLITSAWEIPETCSHILELEKNNIKFSGNAGEYIPAEVGNGKEIPASLLKGLPIINENDFEVAFKVKDGHVKYGDKIIIDQLNWEIRKGDRVCISGPNGAGKSTLLSLITGDHPQAYANDIILFDRKRGSGESIWDIKRKIGLVSPELHLFFPNGTTVYHAIGSGLLDTIGLFKQLSDQQNELMDKWIDIFHLTDLKHKSLSQLSLGEQRKALLARALVKNPPLLVLDEPCQGLDTEQTTEFNLRIDQLVAHFGHTLIYVSHYSGQLPNCIKSFLHLENLSQD